MQRYGWYTLCRSPVKLFIMLRTIARLVVREEEKEENFSELNRLLLVSIKRFGGGGVDHCKNEWRKMLLEWRDWLLIRRAVDYLHRNWYV